MLCHSFLFASPRPNSLTSSSSFFKICAPPLHAGDQHWLPHSWSSDLPFVNAIIPSFSSHVPFSFSPTKYTIFAWFLLLLDGATLSRNLPPVTQQATICSQRPSFLLIFPSSSYDAKSSSFAGTSSLLLLSSLHACFSDAAGKIP